jgi:hypothetical protein
MSAPQESNLLSKGAALPLLQSEPSPAERAQTEHAVRTAATVAAQLEDGSLPRAVLDYIVATSDFRQNRQALEARAASIANHVVHDVKAPNWSGAHPTEVAAYLASLGKQFGDYRRHVALQGAAEANGADRDSIRAAGTNKGASYSDLPWSEEKLGAYAREKGVPWLANHPDLRRLTPAAIETFARMKFDKESYLALTRDAGLSPEKAHGLVKAMEDAKVTPDEAKELARKMGATSKGLTPEQQEQHRTLMESWLKALKADPGAAPGELGKLHKWLDERKAADPGKATAIEEERKATIKVQERLQQERALELNSEAAKAADRAKADAAVQSGNDRLAALLGKPPVAGTPAAPAPGVISPSSPATPEPSKPGSPVAPSTPTAASPKP